MSKRKRTCFVGTYSEARAPSISLPFTLTNFRTLLAEGARPDPRYTHHQIKDWADHIWQRYTVSADPSHVVPAEIEVAAALAQEIEMQWNMYLANTYTLSELHHLDFSRVSLPQQWFVDWLARLHHLVPPGAFE